MIRFSKNKIGLHTLPEKLSESIEQNLKLGVYTLLVCNTNNNYSMHKQLDDDILTKSSLNLERFPMEIFCQTPKLYNLCGSTKFLAWNGNLYQDQETLEIINSINEDISLFGKVGGVIISPGYFKHEILGKNSSIKSLNKLKYNKDAGVQVILCNLYPTLKFAIAKSIPDLYSLFSGCSSETRGHLGVGLNLGFYFVNNLYDIGSEEGIVSLFSEYDELFEKPMSFVIFEDYCFNTQRSCCLGSGDIKYTSGAVSTILDYCYYKHIPIITHCSEDIDFILRIK